MSIPADVTASLREADAQAALGIATMHGFPIPETITGAQKLAAAVTDAANRPDADVPPELPAKATDVARMLEKAAMQRATAGYSRELAREWLPAARGGITYAIARAVPDWTPPLAELFSTTYADFRNAAAQAPQVNAEDLHRVDPVSFEAWQTAMRSAMALDAIVGARITFSGVVAEQRTEVDGLGRVSARRSHPHRLAVVATLRKPGLGKSHQDLHTEAVNVCEVIDVVGGRAPKGPMDGLMRTMLARTLDAGPQPLSGTDLWRVVAASEAQGLITVSMPDLGELEAREYLIDAWQQVKHATHNGDPYTRGDDLERIGRLVTM